jgi:hypothetical protein
MAMNHDQTFRAVSVVFCLVLLPIGIYFRVRSEAPRESRFLPRIGAHRPVTVKVPSEVDKVNR